MPMYYPFYKTTPCSQKGFSLVEILVSIGVIGIVVVAAVGSLIVSSETVHIGRSKTKGVNYMMEYIETLKNLKRNDWDALENGRYIVSVVGNDLTLTTTVSGETVNGYTRYLDIEDAYRDDDGNLVDTPGTSDPSTKKITVTVSWAGVSPGSMNESFYMSRYLDNLTWIETTEDEFNGGTNTGTAVVNNAGGEIVLGAGGSSDWCDPNLSTSSLDLPKNGEALAVTAIEGRAFAGTGLNASGESYININIGNSSPPSLSILGIADGYKTNDVFGEMSYGYIATDTNSKEVVILSISSTPYSEVGYFNIPGNTDGNSLFIAGSVGYVTESDTLWSFDLSSKSGSRSALDSDGVETSGGAIGNSVVVNGSYAYVATSGSTQLQIFDVSSPSNLQRVGWFSTSAGDGKDVFINATATRAYLVTSSSANPELFIVDITTKTGARTLIGSYDTGGMSPRAIEVVPGGRAIVVGVGGEEYQAINISNESAPVRCDGLQVDSGIYDSASVLESDNDAYTYIVTGESSSEFKVVAGGPGGAYASSGVYESATFDPGRDTIGYNRFSVTHDIPIQTGISYQIAVVDAGVNGCVDAVFNDFTFVGPDGTSASYYSGNDAVSLDNDGAGYENPGQCLRYRVYLETSDFVTSPTFYDFTVNYSP